MLPCRRMRCAMKSVSCRSTYKGGTYNAHWAMEMAINPDLPKQCCIVAWNESVPLSLELMTISRIVQSTTTVNPMSNTMPVRRPACLKAYGWPMMPAPLCKVSQARCKSSGQGVHDAVGHVHECALHATPRPSAFQVVLGVEVCLEG